MSKEVDTKRISTQLITLLLVALVAVSCGTVRQSASQKKMTENNLQEQLIGYSKKYLGKPYRYAGRGPHSFDCSGFTSFVFKEFGFNLAASSVGQDRQFPAVEDKKSLRKGDLVFFEGRARNGIVGHVGIVTEVSSHGSFRFIHASTSYGVIVSSSAEPYYASRYLRGGRVLKENEPLVVAEKRKAVLTNHNKRSIPLTAGNNVNAGNSETIFNNPVNKSDTLLLTEHDPLKNPPASENRNSNNQGDPNKSDHRESVIQAVLREENGSLPEPIITDVDEERTVSHTVRPGETLYAISRKYGCSIDQIRHSNPQLGEHLKAGEELHIPVIHQTK